MNIAKYIMFLTIVTASILSAFFLADMKNYNYLVTSIILFVFDIFYVIKSNKLRRTLVIILFIVVLVAYGIILILEPIPVKLIVLLYSYLGVFAVGLLLNYYFVLRPKTSFKLLIISTSLIFIAFSAISVLAVFLGVKLYAPEIDFVGYFTIASFAFAIAALIFPLLKNGEDEQNFELLKKSASLSLLAAISLFFFGFALFLSNIDIAKPITNQTINQQLENQTISNIRNLAIGNVESISSWSDIFRIFNLSAFITGLLNIVSSVFKLIEYFWRFVDKKKTSITSSKD